MTLAVNHCHLLDLVYVGYEGSMFGGHIFGCEVSSFCPNGYVDMEDQEGTSEVSVDSNPLNSSQL